MCIVNINLYVSNVTVALGLYNLIYIDFWFLVASSTQLILIC